MTPEAVLQAFSEYLDVKRSLDRGLSRAREGDERRLKELAGQLPADVVHGVPNLLTFVPEHPLPRGLTAEDVELPFRMREEFAALGETRRERLMGWFPDSDEAMKDILDFMEEERKMVLDARRGLQDLDRKLWTILTGERVKRVHGLRMPEA
ncbi:MAG TPA: hypothetical protein VNZ52_03135 [Candidatus Thermoplasmatota archaeon]|nr:hypothetical protein [Candidatus Thermoplasmatota archaeon]